MYSCPEVADPNCLWPGIAEEQVLTQVCLELRWDSSQDEHMEQAVEWWVGGCVCASEVLISEHFKL